MAAKLTELAGNAAEPEEEKHRKLERLINSAPVMLFMKGWMTLYFVAPFCDWSDRVSPPFHAVLFIGC